MAKITFELLIGAFKLPIKEMKDYFTKKGFELSDNYEKTAELVKNQSWSVSGVTKIRVLQDTKISLQKAIDNGTSFKNWIKELPDWYRQNGWLPKTSDGEGKIGVVYRTNVQSAYNDGAFQRQMDTIERQPYYQYLAIIDPQTSIGCRTLNGKIFKKDDLDFSSNFRPPRHYNCRSSLRTVPNSVAKRLGVYDASDFESAKAEPQFQGKNGVFNFEPKASDYDKTLFKQYKQEYKDSIEPIKTTPQGLLPLDDKRKKEILQTFDKDYYERKNRDDFNYYEDMADKIYYKNDKMYKAFKRYSTDTDFYKTLNNNLRENIDMSDDLNKSYNDMMLDFKIEVEKNIKVFRGVNCENHESLLKLYEQLKNNEMPVYKDNGFLSTSFDRSIANRFGQVYDSKTKSIRMEIAIEKGDKVGIGNYSEDDEYYTEEEFIFKHGSLFDVIDVFEDTEKNTLFVKMIKRKEI